LFFGRNFYLFRFVLVRYDSDEEEVNNKARNLQTFINNQSDKLIQTVEHQKNTYLDAIEKHRQTYKQS
jgi:predicted ATPase